MTQEKVCDEPITFGSLFAGIGGIDLGFERAGMECRWQCECDDYAIRVLAKHWPKVRRISDVRDVSANAVESVDVICGGFPCQPVSVAGKQNGASDLRWLWPEYARVLDELRPKVALLENVPGLLTSLGSTVAADLAEIGFDSEWDCVPAEAFGAPHRRSRVFIVAYPSSERPEEARDFPGRTLEASAIEQAQGSWERTGRRELSDAVPGRVRWVPNSGVCRMVDGVPGRLDRYRTAGNAVSPVVAEWIGRCLVEAVG